MNQIAIAYRETRTKFSRRRTKPRNTDSERRFPAALQQIFEMRCQSDRFLAPWGEPQKRADSNPTKPGVVPALRTSKTPDKILFWTCQMQLIVNGAVVGFLVNNETFRARFNNRNVFLGLHRSDLDRDRGKIITQSAAAFGEIIATNESWM